MSEATFRGRKAVRIENEHLRVTVTKEGGHIAELFHKATDVNPLWTPQWPSIEPSTYDPVKHPEYGRDAESRLLSGILGHNLCADIFGGPSAEEAAAGLGVHGEASVAPYEIAASAGEMTCRATLDEAQLRVERKLRLSPGSQVLRITESLENLSATDRPIAWTQHVTLGAPFLQRGITQFRISATKSKVIEIDFTEGKGVQKTAAEFTWPHCPRRDSGTLDLRVYPKELVSAGFTTHLMDPAHEQAFFMAWSPASKVLAGYVWRRSDFPWLGRWEENCCRTQPPWNGREITCGMEFGVSPMPETRRQMVERGKLFGVPAFRWIPAKRRVQVEYCAFVTTADKIPESVTWGGGDSVGLSA